MSDTNSNLTDINSIIFKKGNRKHYYYRAKKYAQGSSRGYKYAEYSTRHADIHKAQKNYNELLKNYKLIPDDIRQIGDFIEGVNISGDLDNYIIYNKIFANYKAIYIKDYNNDTSSKIKTDILNNDDFFLLTSLFLSHLNKFEINNLTSIQFCQNNRMDVKNEPSISDIKQKLHTNFYLKLKDTLYNSIEEFITFIYYYFNIRIDNFLDTEPFTEIPLDLMSFASDHVKKYSDPYLEKLFNYYLNQYQSTTHTFDTEKTLRSSFYKLLANEYTTTEAEGIRTFLRQRNT